MEISEATDADLPAMSLLARLVYGADTPGLIPVRQGSRTFVAREAGAVAGFVIATFADYGLGESGMIEELHVHPEHQDRGLGAALIGRCERWLAEEGVKVVFVSSLVEARGFYSRLGFAPCTGPWLFHTLERAVSD